MNDENEIEDEIEDEAEEAPEVNDMQSKRFDHKAHRLIAACLEEANIDEESEVILLDLDAWNELVEGLERDLLPGDMLLFAEEHPAKVLSAAKRLYRNKAWLKRANAGE
jgi:hypothetical protein